MNAVTTNPNRVNAIDTNPDRVNAVITKLTRSIEHETGID
jgi:hypothetical protein